MLKIIKIGESQSFSLIKRLLHFTGQRRGRRHQSDGLRLDAHLLPGDVHMPGVFGHILEGRARHRLLMRLFWGLIFEASCFSVDHLIDVSKIKG